MTDKEDMETRSRFVAMRNLCILVAFLSFSYVAHARTTATSCMTADDCPFLYCCVMAGGNTVDQELAQGHANGTGIVTGKRAGSGHCQPMKGLGAPCWTKTDVAFLPPHDMTDDCPCSRGFYCVANGVFLPGGQVGVCSV